jgi:hypothetical protein
LLRAFFERLIVGVVHRRSAEQTLHQLVDDRVALGRAETRGDEDDDPAVLP